MSEDVKVTIGGDLTPFKLAMEQVKAQAAETGNAIKEKLGIESGSGFREENRAVKGVERFTAALANAKDPISGFGQALEGLAQGFRLTGAIFAGFAIGDFIREQLEKAADSAQEFYEKTDQIFAVGKDSSRQFAEEAVKNFDDAEKAYGKEGFLTKLIFGAGQEKTLATAKATVEEIRQQVSEANAQIIRDQTGELSQNSLVKANAKIALTKDEYARKEEDAKSPEEKAALKEQEAAKIDEINHEYFQSEIARIDREEEKKAQAAAKEKSDVKALGEERAKQVKLADEAGGEKSGPARIAALKKELDQATIAVKTTWGTALEQAKLVTAQMEAQNKLAQAQREEATKKKQIQDDIIEKQKSLGAAQNEQRSALEETTVFHGEASSLRKIGLGGSVSQNNTEQVKKMTEANKKLDDINAGIAKLNASLEGV